MIKASSDCTNHTSWTFYQVYGSYILYRRITNLCPWPVLLGQRTVPSREVFVPSLAYELFSPTRISDCGQGTRIVFQIKTEVRWSKVFLAFALVRESANWETPLTQRNFVPAIDSGWLRASAHSQISNPLNHVVVTCSSPWRRRCLCYPWHWLQGPF